MVKKATEAIIAEERGKNHKIVAERLEAELNKNHHELIPSNQINGNAYKRTLTDLSAENLFIEIQPQRNIASLILPDHVIHLCKQFIQEHYRADLLRSYGLEPRNRILLIGAPGTGKTSLAEAIAEAMMQPLLVVKYDNIIGKYLGETASRLRKLMDYVSTRKCVLFFDEFETLGKERGDSHETGEIKRVVSSLLLHIDDLPSHVTVIAATNHPELLDKAVWRRFQIRMNLPMPTRSKISFWLKKFQQEHNINFEYSNETIAKKLHGSSFSEVEEFGLSVLRTHVLALPDSNMKAIVSDELKNWNFRNTTIDPKHNQIE